MDRRLYPANARVAHESLRGKVDGVIFTSGTQKQVSVPVLDLNLSAPGLSGRRDRQRLLGDPVTVLEDQDGLSFVMCHDGYVGYVDTNGLAENKPPTHVVATMSTHAYAAEDFKSAVQLQLPFGAKVVVLDERKKFFETSHGFVSKKHLRPIDQPFDDIATIAQLQLDR